MFVIREIIYAHPVLCIVSLKPNTHVSHHLEPNTLHRFPFQPKYRHRSVLRNAAFSPNMIRNIHNCRSQWPRGLRHRSSAARLLRSWVRIPPEAWIFVCCECCVLSGRGLCDGLIIRSEESYRLWRVVVCDQETS